MSPIAGAPASYDDLSAVFLNCTLKASPALSHTQYLLDHVGTVLERAGARVDARRKASAEAAAKTAAKTAQKAKPPQPTASGSKYGGER